ncbi:polysaccharide deacetylase family protein [Thalassobacillus pellis]|uniref:polysaccharide deacetylase family protein n=1 Tax=Thalassobacillus pellis TaxID=748008 RepID=UPI00195F90C2|nr:polysaccharide deacetylase family protein [Thalassobacillus pellis]MBM7551919.1 peptidoglycan/xylan/chitin deacetylase (PgdA/CDA1 family) [Thalassobacillus pellis]
MIKPFIIYLSLVVLLVLTACSMMVANTKDSESRLTNLEKSEQFKIDIDSIIEEYDEYRLAVHFPETSNDHLNQVVLDYINKQIADFKQKSYQRNKKMEGDFPHELNIEYEILYLKGSLLGVEFTEKASFKREQTLIEKTILNYDLKNGERLQFKNLFKQKSDVKALSSFLPVEGEEILTEESVQFYFADEGLAVSPRIPLPANKVKIIPKEEISSLLKERYAAIFDIKSRELLSVPYSKRKDASSVDIKTYPLKNNKQGKKVALTFDDGPHRATTLKIAKILDAYEVKATFFVLGNRVKYYPEVLKKLHEIGHEIGNHSWSHRQLEGLTKEELKQQITVSEKAIEAVIGEKPALLRPPYGAVDSKVRQYANSPLIGHSISTDLWRHHNANKAVKDVMSKVGEGDIITLQGISPTSVDTVKQLVRQLIEEGYQLVTVSELLHLNQLDTAEKNGRVFTEAIN